MITIIMFNLKKMTNTFYISKYIFMYLWYFLCYVYCNER